jgi:hypothetical protein
MKNRGDVLTIVCCYKLITTLLTTGCALMSIMIGTGFAQTTSVNNTISQSLEGDWGKIKFNLRYRYEYVDQAGLKTANGDPVRLRLGYLISAV